MALQISHDGILKDFTDNVLKNVRTQPGHRQSFNGSKYFKNRKGTQPILLNPRSSRASKGNRYKSSFSFKDDDLAELATNAGPLAAPPGKASRLRKPSLPSSQPDPKITSKGHQGGFGGSNNVDQLSDAGRRPAQAPDTTKYMVNKSQLEMTKPLHTSQGARNVVDKNNTRSYVRDQDFL